MADIIFNIAKGREAYYASLPATNDALIAVVLQTSGLGTDAVLRDLDTLAQVLSNATEQTTMGRKTLSGVTVAVDDAGDKVVIDASDIVWTAATGSAVSALVICYDADTTSGTDANLVPIAKYDFTVTPNGGDVTAQVAAAGLYTAS